MCADYLTIGTERAAPAALAEEEEIHFSQAKAAVRSTDAPSYCGCKLTGRGQKALLLICLARCLASAQNHRAAAGMNVPAGNSPARQQDVGQDLSQMAIMHNLQPSVGAGGDRDAVCTPTASGDGGGESRP